MRVSLNQKIQWAGRYRTAIFWLIVTLIFIVVLSAEKAVSPVVEIQTSNQPLVIAHSEPNQRTTAEEDHEQRVQPDKPVLPSRYEIKVPFLVQAPYANWDAVHEEACEEAALIMVQQFLQGRATIKSEDGESEILRLVEYQNKNGYGVSITIKQLADIARDYYGLDNGRVESGTISIEQIKREIAADRPVVIPAAGKLLGNPNFRNGGPNYHMLVIVGYDEAGFITNDPGTKHGQGYRYSFPTLLTAVHDWDSTDILRGQKTYLVFDK